MCYERCVFKGVSIADDANARRSSSRSRAHGIMRITTKVIPQRPADIKNGTDVDELCLDRTTNPAVACYASGPDFTLVKTRAAARA